ncbi:MAG TPA: PLP-dependent lyase/thiolase [Acidimicrobiia bacterium]|nr:PLP-dependent lyase/thiolase [Acidimicrobiia bacterium]
MAADTGSPHPFVRYRWLLDSYRKAISRGWTDDDFVALVLRLDEAVSGVEGHGFYITPLSRQSGLAAGLELDSTYLWVKDETGNVAGSHKARHLFGVLLHLAVDEEDGRNELGIASCGNAALAAAVVARAVERPLRVFIPTWADPQVVERLEALGAHVEVSERNPKEKGDPTFLRFQESVARGLTPFSVQGPITATTLDGGRTLGWELAEQLALARVSGPLRLFVQVGGGALAASVWSGLAGGIREQWLGVDPILHTVQSEAVAPLNRAWRRLLALEGEAMEAARMTPDLYMWPWEEVGTSAASGILDDVTYDWLPVMEAMLDSGGRAQVVSEEMILRANELGRSATGIDVDHTGTAGLAGLLDSEVASSISRHEHVVVLFTGRRRA